MKATIIGNKKNICKKKRIILLNLSLLMALLVLLFIHPISDLKRYDIVRCNIISSDLVYGDNSYEQTFQVSSYADAVEIKIGAANEDYDGLYAINIYGAENRLLESWKKNKLELSSTAGWTDCVLSGQHFVPGETYKMVIQAPALEKSLAIKVLSYGVYKRIINYNFWIAIVLLFLSANIWLCTRKRGILIYSIPILIGIGGIMLSIMASGSGPDEHYHYYATFEVSNVMLGKQYIGLVDNKYIYDYPSHSNANESFVRLIENDSNEVKRDGQDKNYGGSYLENLYQPMAYIMPALGFSVARIFDVSFEYLYMFGRFCNMLLYIVLSYIAIRLIPVNKELMLFITVMPMAMHQACHLSHDVIVNGGMFVFFAFVIKKIVDDKPITWTDIFVINCMLVVFGTAKVVYCVTLFIVLAIPRRLFLSFRDWIMKMMTIPMITLLALMATKYHEIEHFLLEETVISTVTNTYTFEFVFSHPVLFFKAVLLTLESHFWGWSKGAIGNYLGGLSVEIGEYLVISYFFLLLLCSLRNDKELIAFNICQKGILVSVAIIGTIGIIVGFAFAWTTYGAASFGGIQGRYFIPFFPFVFYCLQRNDITVSFKRGDLVYFMWFIFLGYIVYVMSQIEF